MRSRRGISSAYWLKLLLVFSLIVPLLAACGGINETIKESYPLESVNGSGNQTSYVYRAAGKTVPEVARELSEQSKPKESSAEAEDRMFLVYADRIVHLQQDKEKPEDTLVEVDSKEYVKKNYSMSFLEGYLLASMLSDLFDAGRGGGNYRGYTDRDTYKPKTGSFRTATEKDKKVTPPLTVERKGSIFKRSKDAGSGGFGDFKSDDDSIFSKPSKKSGKIIRGGDSDSKKSGGGIFSPKKSNKPKTKSGFGKIKRRR